jgi:hypothetical protein
MLVRIVGWFVNLGEALIALNLVTLLVAALIKRTRGFGAGLLFLSSQFWAISLWVWCIAQVYMGWGTFWLVVGLLLGGIGIIPVAFICLIVVHDWGALGDMIFQLALVFGGYILSSRIIRWRLDSE